MSSFVEHVTHKLDIYQQALERSDCKRLVIAAGGLDSPFRDDLDIPFFVNAYFKEWLPVLNRPDSFIYIDVDVDKPKLYLKVIADYWHTAPEPLLDEIVAAFDVIEYEHQNELNKLFSLSQQTAFIGKPCEASEQATNIENNPSELFNYIDYYRAWKTDYELDCLREANRIAIRGHSAAEQAFHQGCSEYDIHMAYLSAICCQDHELPYSSIVALNQNAAVLHHMILERKPVATSFSFLIDAGAQYQGYGSDITRTYVHEDDNSAFPMLLRKMDDLQKTLISEIKPDVLYTDLHLLAHYRIAALLAEVSIINVSPEEAVANGLTSVFFPHGLGHLIGVQVHDKGGYLLNDTGDMRKPPSQHPLLRCTRKIEEGMTFTIEPGVYFIPMLLEAWRGNNKAINWSLVDELLPYGGIRIEDDVLVHNNGIENFTREAFSNIAA